MGVKVSEITKGSVCVLYEGTPMARLVRVTLCYWTDSFGEKEWSTRPYLERGYPPKIVHERYLTPLTNEMEVLAWAAQS